MKISKLFHWLYAIVMLLPIFAIGVTCAYVIFNKNAYKSWGDYKNVITTNITSITYDNNTIYNLKYKAPSTIDQSVVSLSYISLTAEDLNITEQKYNTITKWSLRSGNKLWLRDDNNQNVVVLDLTNPLLANFNLMGTKLQTMFDVFDVTFVEYKNQTIDNVFYYSIDKVTQSPYFSWSYNSFLVTPFTYIVNLFGMPVDSPIVMLLSYWLDISIIWLVFDMVMYVPLLVHRWLDKGVLE